MFVVLDGVAEGPSMQVGQPIDECGPEDRQNEPGLFKMPRRRGDSSSGHDGASNHAFAVDHSERVAFSLHMPHTLALIHGHRHSLDLTAPENRSSIPLMCPNFHL